MKKVLLALSFCSLWAMQSCKKDDNKLSAPLAGNWKMTGWAKDLNGDRAYQEAEKQAADSNHKAYLRVEKEDFTDSVIIDGYIDSSTYPYSVKGNNIYEVQFGMEELRATIQRIDASTLQLYVPDDSLLTWRFYERN